MSISPPNHRATATRKKNRCALDTCKLNWRLFTTVFMIIVIMVVLYLLFLLWCDQQILNYIFITFLGTTYQFRTRNSINAAPDYLLVKNRARPIWHHRLYKWMVTKKNCFRFLLVSFYFYLFVWWWKYVWHALDIELTAPSYCETKVKIAEWLVKSNWKIHYGMRY